jgi:glycosyltransferase involved in cell wall biosynthesis
MRVTICVCTCNRPEGLDRFLAAVARMEPVRPPLERLDLIIVDNMPDGRAREVWRRHESGLGIPSTFIEEHERGISPARNRALASAFDGGADFVSFLDDDDVPEPDWLQRLLEKQRNSGADIVMGNWRLPDTLRLPSHLSEVKTLQPPDPARLSRYGFPYNGCNVLIGRRAVDGLAGEPPYRRDYGLSGGEDIDFFIRAHRGGAVISHAADSLVRKDPGIARATTLGILKDAFRIGCNRARLDQEHLPDETPSTRRRRAVKRAFKSFGKISARPSRWVAAAFQAFMSAGEIYGSFGGRYEYYRHVSKPKPHA